MARKESRLHVRRLTFAAMLAALLCLVGPLTLPLGPIPLSLTTAGLMLAALLTGPRLAGLACGAYLLLGLAGLPVFSGFQGGVGAFAGPTGGFLLGYLPMTLLCGALGARKARPRMQALGLAAATLLLYTAGTAWYCLQTGAAPLAALALCVLPFLPGDALKIAAVLMLLPRLKKGLER